MSYNLQKGKGVKYMRLFVFRFPIKIFWYTISFISIMLNLMVYLYQRTIVVYTSTGYSLNYLERLIFALQDFYSIGV